MVKVVGVKFRNGGKIYYFNPGELKIEVNSHVIVETSRGVEYGLVVAVDKEIKNEEVVSPLKDVTRVATAEDDKHSDENLIKEKEAFDICTKKIEEHNLNMKLIEVEYTFDRNKILFYFTADGRIDFRDLVKDLAAIFKTRIELRQIGVRDESKMMGGIGICGRVICCKAFLADFEPVSIKMAKEQELSLNPTKISGSCGRLMCCLKYEEEAYLDIIKRLPRIGAVVDTPDGPGTVMGLNILKENVRVKLDKENISEWKNFKVAEVKIIKKPEKIPEVEVSIETLEKIEEDVDIEALKEILD